MIVVNLEKYSDDGYKKSANSLNASAPDNITHVRFYYDDFAGSNYVQGAFVAGNNSTVQYDASGVSFSKFKMFVSTDGINYTERKSYGGTEGLDRVDASKVLDPTDFDDSEIIVKRTVSSVEQFIPMSLQGLVDLTGLNVGSSYGEAEIIISAFTYDNTDIYLRVESNLLKLNNTVTSFIDLAGTQLSPDIWEFQFLQAGVLAGRHIVENTQVVHSQDATGNGSIIGYITVKKTSDTKFVVRFNNASFQGATTGLVPEKVYLIRIKVMDFII